MAKLVINNNIIVINRNVVEEALNYAETLIGLPYRWFDPNTDTFNGNNIFWCENSPPPSAEEILKNDKSIVCTGLPNLIRRFRGLTIPGLANIIRGKYSDVYKACPGGTGAWFAYLRQNKRLKKLDMNKSYPKGSLLIARFKGYDKDQGHVAIIYNDVVEQKTINDQKIIHSGYSIEYAERNDHKNHGSVKIEDFSISNNLWKWDKISYYKYVCLPEDWLIFN